MSISSKDLRKGKKEKKKGKREEGRKKEGKRQVGGGARKKPK